VAKARGALGTRPSGVDEGVTFHLKICRRPSRESEDRDAASGELRLRPLGTLRFGDGQSCRASQFGLQSGLSMRTYAGRNPDRARSGWYRMRPINGRQI
jgi:hypothetical protein